MVSKLGPTVSVVKGQKLSSSSQFQFQLEAGTALAFLATGTGSWNLALSPGPRARLPVSSRPIARCSAPPANEV